MQNWLEFARHFQRVKDVCERKARLTQKGLLWEDIYEILHVNAKKSVKNKKLIKTVPTEKEATDKAKEIYVAKGVKVYILPIIHPKEDPPKVRYRIYI